MNARTLLRTTYIAGFLFSFQVALTVYINSSFLATKIPEILIGGLYTASAILSIVGLFVIPRLMKHAGTKPVLAFLGIANIINLLVLIYSHNTIAVISCFVLFFTFNTLIYFGLDILIESYSLPVEQGRVRGIYLTSLNLGFMIAPLIGGYIVDRLSFGSLYGLAVLLAIPTIVLLLFNVPNTKTINATKTNFFAIVQKFTHQRNLGAVFGVNFILQFFYAWMVIYTPIYLHEQIGISWDTIGLMFTLMLSAFVLFQYITGKIADRLRCERELMVLGLIVMGVATLFITRAPVLTFWGLVAVLFATRVGASIVEVVTESYFFRNVHTSDTESIGFFRNTYPFAYIIAPALASILMKYISLWILFIILGIFCILGIFIALRIKEKGYK